MYYGYVRDPNRKDKTSVPMLNPEKHIPRLTVEPMIKDVIDELLDELCDKRKGSRNYKRLMKAAEEARPYEIADDNEVYTRIMKEGRYGKVQ